MTITGPLVAAPVAQQSTSPKESLAAQEAGNPAAGGSYFVGYGSSAAVVAVALGMDSPAVDIAVGFDVAGDAPPES